MVYDWGEMIVLHLSKIVAYICIMIGLFGPLMIGLIGTDKPPSLFIGCKVAGFCWLIVVLIDIGEKLIQNTKKEKA